MNSDQEAPGVDARIKAFLDTQDLADVALDLLPSDASARRYYRLAGSELLLMDDLSDPVGFTAFIQLSEHLRHLGLSAPKVMAFDALAGLALIEDFGSQTYGRLLKLGHDEQGLYALAIDALVHLHNHPQASRIAVPAYDLTLLLQEITIFSEWFVPAFSPKTDVAAFDKEFRGLWQEALSTVVAAPPALVLRDFHIDNLMLLDDRKGVAACGLLDFQDGVLGCAEYDLMSLLQDARRGLAAGLEEAMLARYLGAVDEACGSPAEIMERYHLVAAQRHCRLMGLFPRLHLRDGKSGYLRFMPRVVGQFENALEAASLDHISHFMDKTLPGWRLSGELLKRD